MSKGKLAKRYGISVSTVKRLIRKHGASKPSNGARASSLLIGTQKYPGGTSFTPVALTSPHPVTGSQGVRWRRSAAISHWVPDIRFVLRLHVPRMHVRKGVMVAATSCGGAVMASVFISHRGVDRSAAEQLAGSLRDRGHNVWIDTWKINIGDSIVAQINAGLSDASFLLLCCSGEPSVSPWMDREWMSTLARQLEGAEVRVLPVLLTGGSLPSILSDIKYANLAANWHDGVDAICEALG